MKGINKKISILLITFIGLLPLACNSANKRTDSDITIKQSTTIEDEKELLSLVRNLYEWYQNKSSMYDFDPISDEKEESYVGIDFEKNKLRLEELQKSNFFSEEFLNNYNAVALEINKRLKNRTMKWLVGDVSPFGNGADPWCDCQDYPDNYWNTLQIDSINTQDNRATFIWRWGEKEWENEGKNYRVRAIKENNKWKISYLQGFDFHDYIESEDALLTE